ncbi:IPT/TIG domain-containing protein [Paracidobacterium acidisoli]|nr:IPT/TIG domain-containing protein [Paracidobacterium acidisoli]MBT9333202.1 IPT/TIG domain-containing protein [Paracidobacterium acidisoli]
MRRPPGTPFAAIAGTILAMLLLFMPPGVRAGGPRWVAGSSYFSPSVMGHPIIIPGGKLICFFDLGDLSPTVTKAQADALVASARLWNNVPTAAFNIAGGGNLAEDVNGTNVTVSSTGVVTMPVDLRSTATSRQIGVVYDEDGSVINALYGPGASDPSDCQKDSVFTYVDNFSTAGTLAHGVMLINGLCAMTSTQLTNLQYQIARAFGRLAGLDWSSTNEEMFVGDQITTEGLQGWPVMHPVERLCDESGNACMPNMTTLRPDDMAALSRLYPVTSANIGSFISKKLTVPNTISVTGTIHFKNGQGMQGVNVVLRPLVNGEPDIRYTVTAVSGVLYQGNAGNRVNGPDDAQGNALDRFGSSDPSLEGYFDLSDVALPSGVTSSDYQLTFEPINPEYVEEFSVGPYVTGQVTPSGTMPVITLHGLTAGSSVTEDVVIDDSAGDTTATSRGVGSSEEEPSQLAAGGEWMGQLDAPGQTVWFAWRARANREFTIEGEALDASGQDSQDKARLVLGMWNGTADAGTLPAIGTLQPLNGDVVGLTTLPVATTADGEVRLGIADARGDGRPDYLYRGRVLYADTVSPARLPVSGGPILIAGMGFHLNSTVTVNGNPAEVTSVSPTEITAIAPASGGTTGNVLVEVEDPQTLGMAAIEDGLSYEAENGDLLAVVTAPSGSVDMGVPLPFTVRALDETGQIPASGVTVTFRVTEGAAALGCGAASCSVVTGEDGTAAVLVSAASTALTQITASLSNGATTLAEFTGVAPPSISAVTPNLYLAIGATTTWNPQGLVLNNGAPVAGQSVSWTPMGIGATVTEQNGVSNSGGLVSSQIAAGPLGAGDVVPVDACLTASSTCTQFMVLAVHTQTAALAALSGTTQNISAAQSLSPVVLRVTDAIGHPMAGAVVTFYETTYAWTEPCPQHGRCPAAPVLGQQTVQLTSLADGSVTLVPSANDGQPERLIVTAVTGDAAVLNFQIEQYP